MTYPHLHYVYITRRNIDEGETLREPNPKLVDELRHAREALEREMAISQRVKASTMENVDLATIDDPPSINITKELAPTEKSAMVDMSREYKDVFAWSYKDMQGLETDIINTRYI